MAGEKFFEAMVGPEQDFVISVRWVDGVPVGTLETVTLRESAIDDPLYSLELLLKPVCGGAGPTEPGPCLPNPPSAPAPAAELPPASASWVG